MRIRRRRYTGYALLLTGLGLLGPRSARAHLMPATHATVNVVANNAYIVLSVPTSVLRGYDDNHDRMIDVQELARHGDALRAQILGRFSILDARLRPVSSVTWLLTPNTGDAARQPSTYLLVVQSVAFPSPPTALSLRYDLFGPTAAEQQLTLTTTRGSETEGVLLTPAHPTSRLFRPPLELFADFVQLGIWHIVRGLDHLAFLLTVVAAGAGLRYWLLVITSFTLAHSVSLALAVFGIVSLPSRIVEPAILLTIVVMAADAIRHRHRPLWFRVSQVFGCGLIHGLGFASGLTGVGIDLPHRLISLLGFNSGIEIGQTLCVAGMLGMLWLVRRLPVHERLAPPSLPSS